LFVCLQGRGPDPVAYDPNDSGPATPFDPRSHPGGARLRRGEHAVDLAELRRALETFLQGQASWPPFQYFQVRGQAALYAEAKSNGGPRQWASVLGLVYKQPDAISAVWTEDRLRTELATYLEGRTAWPTCKAFIADGHRDLRKAIRWNGGPERWAAAMGVSLASRNCASQRWSYARVLEAVREFVGGSETFPTQKQFFAAGLSRLESQTRKPEVRKRLLADLGVAPPRRLHGPWRWTDERIRESLDELLEGRDTWPSPGVFAEAGLAGMHATLKRRGVLTQWAERYGFEPLRAGRAAWRLASPGPPR
jgi:hypothetical protein